MRIDKIVFQTDHYDTLQTKNETMNDCNLNARRRLKVNSYYLPK